MIKKKYIIISLIVNMSLMLAKEIKPQSDFLDGLNNIASSLTSFIPEGTNPYISSGPSWLSYGSDYEKYSDYKNSSSNLGYAIGFNMPIEFLNIDIAYNRRNNSVEFFDAADSETAQLDTTITTELNLDYINFGIVFPYNPPIPLLYETLSIHAGVNVGYFLGGSSLKTIKVDGYNDNISKVSIDSEADNINKLDYGLVFGVKYDVLNMFSINLNYFF